MIGKLIIALTLTATTYAGDISIHISSKHAGGDVYVGLFKQAKGFLHLESAYKKIILKTKKSLDCHFKDIPKGTYAIAIFHDANRNGKLDKNFIGLPKEETGTSHNVVAHFGPPSFEKAKFLHTHTTQLSISLH